MDNISKLYADVSKKLYIGTEDKIRGLLSTKEGADKFYNVMKDKGVDLGNHTDYMVGLGHENLVEAKDAPPVGVNTEWNADVDIAKETADESKYQAELAENKLEWAQKQKPFGGSKPFGRVELGVNDKVVKSDDGRFLTESGRSYDNFAEANLDQNITDQHKSQTYRLSRMQEQLGEQQEKAGELLEKSKDADSKQFSQALGMGPYYGSMMRHESSQTAAIRKAQADLDDAQEALNELYRQRAEGGDTNYFKNGVDFFVNLGKGEFKKAGESFVKGVNDQTTTLSRVGRGFKDVADDLSNWDFGMTDARNEGTLLSAILKRDNGQSLTEQEQFMLDAAALRAGISSEVGDLGLAYTAGNVTAGSLPFMIEMMANPLSGLGKGATKSLTKYAVKKYGREAVKNNMKKYLATKAVARVSGDIVGSLGMTATSGFAGTAANAAERQIGSVQTAYDENGNIVYGGHVGGEDAVTAWAKAGLDRTFENWSEMSGAYFAALGAPIKAVIGKGIGRIVPDKVLQSDFAQWATKKYGDLKNSKFYKGVDAVKSRAQIGGLFEEYLEEKYGDLMRLSIGDTTFDTDSETGIFNLERNVETLVSLIPTQVGFGMLRLGGARTANYQYRQQRNAADKYLEGVLGEDWKGFRSQLDAAQYDPAAIAQIYTSMNQVGESNLPMNVRRAVMSYINAQQSVLHSDPALYQSRVNNVDVEETDGKITAYDKDAQGNILSSKTFETREEADAYAINRLEETRDDDMHRFMQTARGLDMLGYNQLSEQFMQERGFDNMTADEQAEFLDEMSSGRGKTGKAWTKYKVKAIENNMSGTNFAISSWEQAHGLEPGTIEDILDRKPTERTIEESNILTEAYGMLHDLAHPQGKVHVDQSRLDGIKFADEANLDAVLGTSEEEAAEVQPNVDIPAEMKAKRDVATNIALNTLSNDTDMLTLFGEAMDMNGADAETVIGALSSMDEQILQNTLLDVMNEGVHNERFQSIVDAVNAQAAYDAFVQRTGEKIDERANRETNRRIFNGSLNGSRRTEKPTILTATDGEHTYQITNSTDDITTDENGSVTSEGVITAIDENGNVAVFKGSPSLQITGEEESSTYEEIMRQNLQESVSEIIEPTTEEEVAAENAAETQSQPSESADLGEQPAEVAGHNEAEEQVPSEGQAPQPTYEAESKMVYDEKGNEAYDRMPIADTMEDLLDGQLEDEQVAELIDNNIEAYEKEVAKLNEKKPKKTTSKSEMIAATNKLKADRAEAERKLKYWQDVKSELAKITHTTEEEVKAVEDELNATEETDASNMPSDAMSLASLFISDAKITPESFRGETGYSTAEQKKFMGIIATQAKGGKTITELAEELVALDNSEYGGAYFGGDTNNARNEIISALQAAETRADLKANARTNADVAKQDYARRRDEAYLDEYGMTYEEYVASEETSLKDAIRNEAGVHTAALHAESEEAKSEAEDAPQEQAPTAEETENARREPLRQKAREWSEKTGADVVLLESIDDVESDYVRNQIIEVEKRNQQVKGWYDDGSGRVFIYMPHAESEADVEATFVHEVVSHKGLRELLGKSAFDSLCDNVWDMMSEDAKRDFLAYVGVSDMAAATAEDKRAAADEYIAHLAERTDLTDAEKSVWDNIVKMIRTALETLGLSISITDDVLSNLIKASYAEMMKNRMSEESVDENKGSEKQGVRFSVGDKKKSASETESVQEEHHPSVVSSADGAKVLNNLDNLIKEYEKNANRRTNTFLGDISKAIRATKHGSNSQYATFETVNGNIVTIRLADHNAKVSTFDNHGEKEGISIVVTPKNNTGLINDGGAHVVEYYYNAVKLRRSENKPLVEILKSIKQSLYSGVYKDNTGLAERDEANTRFRIANNNQEVFVSNAEQAVKGIKQEKATPQQWKAMIQSKGGLKAGEDKWLGLSEWLDEKAKAAEANGSNKANVITKQEVLDFIGENKIRIEEVEYGDANSRAAFASLKEEYDQWLREEGYDYAWEQLRDRYGDDAEIAFMDLAGELAISNEEAATALLGENVINSTRLDYTTEGLENKREIALTVPTIESWNESDDIHFGDAGGGRAVAWARFGETVAYETVYDVQEVTEFHEPYENLNRQDVYKPVGSFKSGDYVVHGKGRDGNMIYVVYINGQQLPVAHATLDDARNAMNEYYKENPRKLRRPLSVLVIDEIQSKRHQEGREKGYRGSFKVDEQKVKELRDELSAVRKRKKDIVPDEITGIIERVAYRKSLSEDLQAELRSLEAREQQITMEIGNLTRIPNGIPDAPFDKNWHELAMKRMLRLAAEEGFDKVAWTKGAQQAERYDLGGKVDEIKVTGGYDGIFTVIGRKDGGILVQKDVEGEQGLADMIGKDLARKAYSNLKEGKEDYLNEDGAVSFTGDNLSIGGEGMKGFYDKMLPSFMNKYGKKWGVKVGEVELPEVEEAGRTMWSVDVTPEMKESVMEGQVMFRKNTLNNNGEGESTQELFLSLQNKEGEEYNDTVNEIADRIVSGRARVGREDLQGRHGAQTQVSAAGEIISADRGRVSETVQQGSDASEESASFRTVKSEYADKVDGLNKGIEEKGLRGHLGEVPYKKMMRTVYEGNDEIAQNASAMLQDKEWNLYDSIETYLADEAQTMGNEEMWQDVRQSLADAIDFFPSIKDTKYAMWLNKNRDNDPSDPNDGIKRNALLYKLEREERETPVRFRTTPTPVADQAARAQYEAALKRLGYRWSEQWIDGTRSVAELQKAMFGKDFHLADSRDAHEAEKAMTSKIMQKQQRYHKHLVEPLGKAIEKCMKDMPGKSRKKRYENLKKYMYALHGLERNRYIHVRDIVEDEQQLEDYVQYCIQQRQKLDRGNIDITTYFGNLDSYIRQNIDKDFDADKIDKSGIRGDFPTDADALMYIVDTETRLGKERVTELWRRIRDIDDFSLETEYQAGLISGELKAKLASMYGWYIPLRGFEEETAEEAYDYVNTSERAVGGPTVMGARGRKSKADDPIATMLSIGSQAIHRAERNEVKKKFYRAAKDYMKQNGQGGLVSELFVWEAKVGTDNQGNPIYGVQFPDITEGMSADDVADEIANFEAQMKDLADKGEARQVRQGINIAKAFENKKSLEEHIVRVYENGQVHLLYINGNPRAAQSLNGTLKTNSKNVAIKAFRKLQRAISQMMTSLNPTFALASNPIRDYQTALMNTLINDGILAGGKFMVEHFKSSLNLGWSVLTFGKGGYARMFSLYKEGKLDMSKEEHRLFKEFADNGGITGFIESSAIEDYKDMMDGMLRTRKLPTLKRFVDKANGVLSVPNELMENMARFATYKAARKRGLSVQKSVKRAKDYSLNFNQRGLANGEGWIGSLAWAFNFCYLFVNPTMQAFGMMLNNFKNHPAKTLFYQFALPPMMASMIVPVLNIILASWLDDDDDDDIRDIYGTMPEWKRRNNICLYAGNGNWITIPLPIELRAFYGIGETLASELCGDTEMGKALGWDKMKSDRPAGWQIFDLLMTLTPTSIVYSGGGVDGLGDAFVMTLPQVLKPIGELLRNQKWTGAPIWNDAEYIQHSPEWQKAYSNTNPYIVEFCRWLNETTGGDEVEPGSININPAKIDHFIQGYFGGLYKSLSEVSAIGKLIVSGNADAIRAEQIPLLKAVWYNYDEAQQSKRYNALFHKYKEEAEQTKAWMRGYEDRGDVDKLMKLLAEPRYERMLLINSYNSERQKFSAGIRKSHAREEENTEEVYKRIRMLGDKAIVEALDKIK